MKRIIATFTLALMPLLAAGCFTVEPGPERPEGDCGVDVQCQPVSTTTTSTP